MTSTYPSTSVADMKARRLTPLTKIEGKPNLSKLLTVRRELTALARQQDTSHGPLGMIYLTLEPHIYSQYTPVPYIAPQPPGDSPNYTPNATDNMRRQQDLMWAKIKMEWENHKNMNDALVSLFLSSIDEGYRTEIQSNLIGIPARTFHDYFAYFLQKYGRVTTIDINRNRNKMTAPWDADSGCE